MAEAAEPVDTTRVYSARSCVSIFENQTISSSRSITGCDSLIVRDVTVADAGNLTLTAPDYVVLYGAFEVVQGGTLNINEEEEPLILNFLMMQLEIDFCGGRRLFNKRLINL